MLNDEPRIELRGSTKAHHSGFALLPRFPAEDEFCITLRVRKKRALPVWKAGRRLTHRAHRQRHGPNSAALAAVREFALAHGLSVDEGHHIRLRGRAADFERALDVELRSEVVAGRTRRVRQGPICLPAALAEHVTSITGLDNRPFARPHFRIAQRAAHAATAHLASAAAAVAAQAWTPGEIADLYNFPRDYTGAGQKIAIVELGGGFHPAELTAYFEELHIAPPSVRVVEFKDGGVNAPGCDPLDPLCRDPEVLLDLEVAGAVAPGAELLVYFAADDSDEGFLNCISAIVHDEVNKPGVVSISWGGPESTATEQFRAEFNRLLETAAHLGITVCAATGDNAAPDFPAGDPGWDTHAHTDFPASSPWVLACGGTRIHVEGGAIAAEELWHDGPHDGAGGGISRCFPVPDYQSAFEIPRAVNPDAPPMRGIPDVSANAAPASGYRILCNGQRFPDAAKNLPAMGGTSAVAPLWAGLVARVNEALGRNAGFVNPNLYACAGEVFVNPAEGCNGAYSARAGWNPCTGLGSVDGTKLLEALRGRSRLVG